MNPEMERWEPEGWSPRGGSGLILSAERSASALYLRGNLHASWGIQLGDTVSPSVTPCVSPRCRPSDGDKAPHVGTACRVWIPDVVVPEWRPDCLNVCFFRLFGRATAELRPAYQPSG